MTAPLLLELLQTMEHTLRTNFCGKILGEDGRGSVYFLARDEKECVKLPAHAFYGRVVKTSDGNMVAATKGGDHD